MKPVIIILTMFLLIAAVSCNTTEPTEENILPGRRDYEWTVDTITVPWCDLYKISGSSSTDVWAIGPGNIYEKTIWHYDGISWNTDGILRTISPLSIISFSRNSVWIAGYSGDIWHYNGSQWEQSYSYVKEHYKTTFLSIWGTDEHNIYAIGSSDSGYNVRKAVILNYNGSIWSQKEIIDLPYYFKSIAKDLRYNTYYIIGSSREKGLTNGLFKYNGQTDIEMLMERDNTSLSISNIDGKVYLVDGKQISLIENGGYKEITTINDEKFTSHIYGRNEKDIFLNMNDGIAHYNGNNVEYILKYNSSSVSLNDAAIFKDEIFFLAVDNSNNHKLIFRGKLRTTH